MIIPDLLYMWTLSVLCYIIYESNNGANVGIISENTGE